MTNLLNFRPRNVSLPVKQIIRRKLDYYRKIADDSKGKAALLEWDRVKEAKLAGKEPRPKVEGITVAEICDRYLQENETNVHTGELSPYTWRDYKRVTDKLVSKFGRRAVLDLGPHDFTAPKADFAKDNQLVTLSNSILRVRGVFKHAAENQWIDKSVFFGTGFKPVRKEALKIHRSTRPKKLFSASEVSQLIALLADSHGLRRGGKRVALVYHQANRIWFELLRKPPSFQRHRCLHLGPLSGLRWCLKVLGYPKGQLVGAGFLISRAGGLLGEAAPALASVVK